MTARRDLPSDFVDAPFTVATAVAAGVGRDRLARQDLARPFWGIRMPAALASGTIDRCRAALLGCPPDAYLRGATAAKVIGMPVPTRFLARTLVDVGLPAPARAVRRGGIAGAVSTLRDGELITWSTLPVTTPERTWCDLGTQITVPELVAAGDWLLRSGLATATSLAESIAARVDRRGTRALVAALELLDAASESPKESELRALVVLAGLPRPVANPTIRHDDGRFVARVDLLFEGYREILEYQGDHHRTDVAQWRRDRSREAELESLGFHVMEVTAADLHRPRELVERITRNLGRAGWSGALRGSRWFPGSPVRREDGFRP